MYFHARVAAKKRNRETVKQLLKNSLRMSLVSVFSSLVSRGLGMRLEKTDGDKMNLLV